jgi:iron complex outermembrane recepter protein
MGKHRSIATGSVMSTLLLLAVMAGVVRAQTTEAPSAASGSLEEVLVTATKRTASVQDVPVSITALSARDLESMGAQQFFDYATSVPNLSFGIGAADGNLAGRGIALRGIQGANTTGFYIDDTPVLETLDPHIVDIARIEVLRGPQGTLYGAESMGGTLRIITEQPDPNGSGITGQLHASGSDTEHGSFNGLTEGVLNMPLIAGTLALRASAFYESDSGWFDKGLGPESAPPTETLTNIGQLKYYGGQIALRFQPISELSITPRVMYQRTNEYGDPYAYDSANNLLQREVFNLNPGGTDEWWLASLTVNYTLPFGSFVSSSGFFDRHTFELEDDTDVTQFDFALASPLASPITRKIDLRRWAQEIRFASSFQGPFQILLGGFYSDSTRPRDYEWTAPGLAATGAAASDLVLSFIDSREAKESALFGDASYELMKNLKATVGMRWFKDQETFQQYTNGDFFGGVPSIYNAAPISATGFTPKYLLEYKATPDVLLYSSAAKGFREGGANIALPPGPPPLGCDQDLANIGLTAADVRTFTSDDLWDYEAGVKSSFAEHRATLNLTGFWIEWDKIQQLIALPLCGYGVTGNSGRARSQGVELEFNGRLTPALTLGVGFGYENARITEQGAGSPQTVGSPVYQVPRATLASDLEYVRPLTTQWEGFARLDYDYVGGSYSANNITPVIGPVYRPSYSITDLRLGGRCGNYEVALFAKNLANEHANLGDAILIGAEILGHPRFVINQPRTIGIEGRVRFQ